MKEITVVKPACRFTTARKHVKSPHLDSVANYDIYPLVRGDPCMYNAVERIMD